MPKDYLTVVIQLPDDPEQRKAVTAALPLSGNFHGGCITAMSLEDEITVNEILENKLHSDEVQQARAQAKAVAARAETVDTLRNGENVFPQSGIAHEVKTPVFGG